MAEERLQKIIAAAGIASRRKAEELITQGRVTVNGEVVTALGSKADLSRDHVKVDGKLLQGSERHIYLLLHKPKGYVTTVSDPEGRPTVMDLVKNVGERVYPLGRLDYNSEGLLLLSNDGDLANYLTQAASHVPKVYLVKVAGNPADDDVASLSRGIRIGSKPGARGMHAVRTAPAEIKLVKSGENPWYEVTLYEGKNRQIRRMFEEIGHHVEKIKRVRYGPLSLDVEPGEFRELTPKEVSSLRRPQQPQAVEHTERDAARASVKYLGKARPVGRREDRRERAPRDRAGTRPFTREDRTMPHKALRQESPEHGGETESFRKERKGFGGRPPRREDRFVRQRTSDRGRSESSAQERGSERGEKRFRPSRGEDRFRTRRSFDRGRPESGSQERGSERGEQRFPPPRREDRFRTQRSSDRGQPESGSQERRSERGKQRFRPSRGEIRNRPRQSESAPAGERSEFRGGERKRFGQQDRGRFGRAKSQKGGSSSRRGAGGRSEFNRGDRPGGGSRPRRPRKP